MRLSSVQKDVLFVLYGLTQRGQMSHPLPAMQLLTILNQARLQPVADTNFRRSCHTLAGHGLLKRYRYQQSLNLGFDLTPKGLALAADIYNARLEEAQPS